jgi:CDP-paratose 2-epimerase
VSILVTGGAGFIGSTVAEYYAKQGKQVIVFDNLSRFSTLPYGSQKNALNNWNYLKKNYQNIRLVKGDVRNFNEITEVSSEVSAIIHTAGQVAVTTSVKDPRTDFETNALGTFNVLEAARRSKTNPGIVFCSTNKVYGSNVNNIPVKEKEKRYSIVGERFALGVPEDLPTDLCEHTPYGCSKFVGDLYVQDYAYIYGLKTGVFRMSCIYGERQYGVEDQGWVAWFVIATLLNKPMTIYGDGKQVRDLLFVSDVVAAYDAFLKSNLKHAVFNIGGGPNNTLSILELLDTLETLTGKKVTPSFSDWRPSDQKVYISDIRKVSSTLAWKPLISPKQGVKRLVDWADKNKEIL